MSDEMGLVPVAWRCEEIVGGGDWIYSDKPHTGYEPVYDRAAIERLVAERDEARKAAKEASLVARTMTHQFQYEAGKHSDWLERCMAAEAQRDKLKGAAGTYFERYCQDEAAGVENCVCGEQQHRDAVALRDALASIGETP